MLKRIRKVVFGLLLIILMLVLVLLLTINIPFDFFVHEQSEQDYSHWMSDTLTTDQRIIDVAMLGAHDAFSADINLFSQTDVHSAASIQTGITGLLIKGFSVKQSKTQVSGITELLTAGVRYFDIRLTYNEEKSSWYTTHTYFSNDLASVLEEMNTFLFAHPGEFLLLDIQHVYGIDYDNPAENDVAFAEIRTIFASANVLEYAYEQGTKELNEITYGDITNNKVQAGVMIFSKMANNDNAFWDYWSSIYSAWPNTDVPETAYACLDTYAANITSGDALTGALPIVENASAINAQEGIRVLQGVLTMQMNGEGIINALIKWSLIDRAREFNSNLIDQPNFANWMMTMPVIMVDYADTNYENFLDRVMEMIIYYNETT
ncbi:MAG: hypothetical protein WC874_00255 [Candidatus Izemoplasmatales bacterium]|jgi:hypothetical protein